MDLQYLYWRTFSGVEGNTLKQNFKVVIDLQCCLWTFSKKTLFTFQSWAWRQTVDVRRTSRRPARRLGPVRKAGRLPQKQVLAGESQVHDRDGRGRRHPARHHLLQIPGAASTAPVPALHATSTSPASVEWRRRWRRRFFGVRRLGIKWIKAL